jgi:hypothetical protein
MNKIISSAIAVSAITVSTVFGSSIGNVNILPAQAQKSSNSKTWYIRYTTFIAEKIVKVPGRNIWFRGDNRKFNVDAKSYRTRTDVTIVCETGSNNVTMRPFIGKSTEVTSDDKFVQSAIASSNGIKLKIIHQRYPTIKFTVEHEVGIPSKLLLVNPDIYYSYTGEFDCEKGTYTLEGEHDKAPNHEVYIKNSASVGWKTIYRFNTEGFECLVPFACSKSKWNWPSE